jgi:Carboxypeptidase regulatory-like domain
MTYRLGPAASKIDVRPHMRKELALWIPALALAAGAIVGAAVLDGQLVVNQETGPFPGRLNASDKPLDPGNGIIFGRATEEDSTRPVPNAIVTLTLPGFGPLRVMADSQGQFAFRDLPPGRFSVAATKAGYADGAYGRLRPNGPAQSIELAADQHVSDASLALWKYGAITGRVLDESGDPLVNTTVRVLRRSIVAGRRQLVMGVTDTTDDRGTYRISALEPGEYLVVVPMTQANSPAGWVGLDSALQGFGVSRDVVAALPPPGGGGGATVAFAVRAEVNTGGGVNAIVINSADSSAPPAGVSADGHAMTYQTEFYPSSTTASRATVVTVAAGDERTGIDFQLKPVRTVTLAGTVSAPDGPASGLQLSLIPADAEDFVTPIETATSVSEGNGTFRFTSVPPGQYSLRAVRTPRTVMGDGETTTVTSGGNTMVMRMVTSRVTGGPTPPLPTGPTYWADMNISVAAGDLSDVTVPLRAGLRVSGRVDFVGSADKPAAEQMPAIALSLEPADGRTTGATGTVRGRIEPNGTFTTIGVPSGKYVLRVTPPSGWTLRGAALGGQDIVDTAVELRDSDASGVVITFVDHSGSLTGPVTTPNGLPDATATVIAFASDRSMWTGAGSSPRRIRNNRTGKDGSYSIGGLPAGDYFVAAVPEAVSSDWQSPEFLEAISSSATRVHIEEGDTKTQSLTTARVR